MGELKTWWGKLSDDDRAGGAIASMVARAQEFGATAVRTANEAAPVVGDKIRSLASGIREKATDAVQVADRLESAGNYLREKKLESDSTQTGSDHRNGNLAQLPS